MSKWKIKYASNIHMIAVPVVVLALVGLVVEQVLQESPRSCEMKVSLMALQS